jgi:hypothetical protein
MQRTMPLLDRVYLCCPERRVHGEATISLFPITCQVCKKAVVKDRQGKLGMIKNLPNKLLMPVSSRPIAIEC